MEGYTKMENGKRIQNYLKQKNSKTISSLTFRQKRRIRKLEKLVKMERN
jgi:hypothetical protein